jgi:hypothetical protein
LTYCAKLTDDLYGIKFTSRSTDSAPVAKILINLVQLFFIAADCLLWAYFSAAAASRALISNSVAD